jgi:hypothetical protein
MPESYTTILKGVQVLFYKYIKFPLGCSLWFEWKKSNTHIYSVTYKRRELFICAGIIRIIMSFNPKLKGENADPTQFEQKAKHKSPRSMFTVIDGNRKVS